MSTNYNVSELLEKTGLDQSRGRETYLEELPKVIEKVKSGKLVLDTNDSSTDRAIASALALQGYFNASTNGYKTTYTMGVKMNEVAIMEEQTEKVALAETAKPNPKDWNSYNTDNTSYTDMITPGALPERLQERLKYDWHRKRGESYHPRGVSTLEFGPGRPLESEETEE